MKKLLSLATIAIFLMVQSGCNLATNTSPFKFSETNKHQTIKECNKGITSANYIECRAGDFGTDQAVGALVAASTAIIIGAGIVNQENNDNNSCYLADDGSYQCNACKPTSDALECHNSGGTPYKQCGQGMESNCKPAICICPGDAAPLGYNPFDPMACPGGPNCDDFPPQTPAPSL